MKRFFDAELEAFRSHLLQMGERAMDQTRLAMKSLLEAEIALADKVIDAAYAFQSGGVLFKPTLSVNPQTVRTTKQGALAYFVGGDADYPNDKGFALKGWTKCVAEDNAIIILGDTATSLGKVRITNKDGATVTVDKTWQYVKDDEGTLRIVVHHSSLEYTGD